ncbi:hypothetical protein PF005_g3933 [Phytophthora fragariae]|uniref:Uncharacterized protein n=1 Tax=Phytophthora fragariae TaxID=53985 RepID=A0A6A3Z6H7_9STRA|nr:hypothetical protein PF005_g3933 [Phytophthora fragariae]KAE9356763.1 hypothetical protein PF008_g3469 [Phytophthora fragariae]
MSTLKCNHDAQFVISSGEKHTAAYVVKYCCRNQNPVENYAALSLAAFAKAAKKTNASPADTTAMERGYRIMGSMLYSVTNGQEVAATMAALYILRKSPFWFSHEFVHINLKNLVRKRLDSIEVTVSQEVSEHGGSGLARVVTDNILERYWRRVQPLDNISFVETCEHYEYSGKPTGIASPSSSNLVSFSKTRSRKVVVLCGDEIPDIATNLEQARIDYTTLHF